MDFDKEQLDTALRCQWVVGSFDPAVCPCQDPSECVFSESQVWRLRKVPVLARERERKYREYRKQVGWDDEPGS